MSLVPKIPGEVSEHFPGADRWGVVSGINERSTSWRCPVCCHDERLLVLADRVLYFDCLACWLGQPVQLGLFPDGQS